MLNKLVGDGYAASYGHFRTGHVCISNIALHLVCMYMQLFGNFALLHLLDDKLPGPKLMSSITAGLWSLHVLQSTAPLMCSLATVANIAVAFVIAPHVVWLGAAFEAYSIVVFCVVLAISCWGAQSPSAREAIRICFVLVALQLTWWILSIYVSGVLHHQAVHWNIALFALMSLVGALRDPVKVSVLCGLILGRTLSVATGQRWLLFYATGFLGTVLQAFSHSLSKEEPTLIALQRENRRRKVSYEWSHVVYFPVLLLHALRDTLFSEPPISKEN